MATFILVHGASLGPWSWNLVISSLNRRGHRAINIELPNLGPAAGAIEYAQSVASQINERRSQEELVQEELVIVGHNVACLIIPFLADKLQVKRFIYLAPLIASPGQSCLKEMQDEQDKLLLVDTWPDPVSNKAEAFRYWLHDCDPDIASWASSRFSKHNFNTLLEEPRPLRKHSDTKTSVIACKNDRLINSKCVERLSKSLLNIEAMSIDSGHCPQLSRPQELSLLLMQLGNMKGK